MIVYHATSLRDRERFIRNKETFLNKKKLKRGNFFITDDPEVAIRKSGLEPYDVALLKIKIAKQVIDDLGITPIYDSDAIFQGIPKVNVDKVNELYRTGYIRLDRGR